MLRRTFLRSLAAILGLVALPRTAGAQAAQRTILLQTSPVAGFQYHDGEMVWPMLRIGDTLQLVREPRNAFDNRAVRIEWEGCKLGYVPRSENHAVAQLLDRDTALSARIIVLKNSSDPWQRARFEVLREA